MAASPPPRLPDKLSKCQQRPASPPTTGTGMLERHGLPLGVMRERDLRKLYIGGATPGQAAEQALAHHGNERPAVERIRGKKR
jgi:hypothetical protein